MRGEERIAERREKCGETGEEALGVGGRERLSSARVAVCTVPGARVGIAAVMVAAGPAAVGRGAGTALVVVAPTLRGAERQGAGPDHPSGGGQRARSGGRRLVTVQRLRLAFRVACFACLVHRGPDGANRAAPAQSCAGAAIPVVCLYIVEDRVRGNVCVLAVLRLTRFRESNFIAEDPRG